MMNANAADYIWVAAAVGSNNAAGYQLATGAPVMAIGGFNGTDPSPTLAQFKHDVSAGRIHYFVASSAMHRWGGRDAEGTAETSDQIAKWVASTYPAHTVDGVTVYDLSA
jgi:4-amino-4-deoxy-L-arabinose transferase-like glycosyltransferase